MFTSIRIAFDDQLIYIDIVEKQEICAAKQKNRLVILPERGFINLLIYIGIIEKQEICASLSYLQCCRFVAEFAHVTGTG